MVYHMAIAYVSLPVCDVSDLDEVSVLLHQTWMMAWILYWDTHEQNQGAKRLGPVSYRALGWN